MVGPQNGSIVDIDFNLSGGLEIQKRKPAVIISNEMLMKTSQFVWLVPISLDLNNDEDYPLHVSLDKRSKTSGTICTEQIKSFDYINSKWQFIERLPQDLLEEVKQKARLILQ
ncbi:type II toxin-antitoxin system PemK/MazF family toxin [Latilactobacillus fragifolii]|uniref:type II toxin-antitoxin system PemK/MazF family toxin n=1 Tax=Latilactobacillus fragifolii TaxID=2814244 RepID=UPI001ABAF921|nr:type II toxin-antitoxin system PemK/MazF family toxin [Latilactobacillus fragifolii]